MKRLAISCIMACAAAFAQAQHDMESMPGMQHGAMPVPPAPAASQPPLVEKQVFQDTSGPMSAPVSDNMAFHQVLFDQLEYTRSRDTNGLAWDLQAWYGRDYGRVWFKSEGERDRGRTRDASLDLLWSQPIAAFWDVQGGMRHDFGEGARRNWAAIGIQGVAPYWFDVQATAYLARGGRTAARLKAEYQLLLTQRLYLAPEIEANLYGRSDREAGTGSGLANLSAALRLRYEIRREFAPYLGVSWDRKTGGTADFARAAGEPVSQRRWVAGVRVWF